MPNYKSKMLTFLSIGEMTGLLLDNTDEDGILFAVATDSTNFKIVMWRKNSTATVDNETVYPANGPGRWHVLETGSTGIPSSGSIIQFANESLPASPDTGKSICVLSKTLPYRELIYRWNGSSWVLISYTNMLGYGGGSGSGPQTPGDCPGQIFIDQNNVPSTIYIWSNTKWQQIYP